MKLQRKLAILIALTCILLPFNAAASLAAGSLPTAVTSSAPTAGVTTQTTAGTAGSTASSLPPVLDANGQPVSPGTLPSSPFYWLAGLMQKVQLFFTFDSAQKAALLENQALQSLAGARQMAKAGNTEAAQKSLASYAQKIADAQALMAKLQDPKTVQTLQSAMAKSDAANIEVLSGLLVKIPAPAAKAVALNIMKAIEKVADKMDDADKQKVADEMGKSGTVFNQAQLGDDAAPVMSSLQKALAPSASTTAGTAAVAPLNSIAANKQSGTAAEREKTQQGEKERVTQPKQSERRSISPNRTSGEDEHKAVSRDPGENDD